MCFSYINSHLVWAFSKILPKAWFLWYNCSFQWYCGWNSQNFAKIPQILLLQLHLTWCFPKFWKFTPKYTNILQFYVTWNGSSEISLKSLQVLLSKHHIMGKIKVLLCIYVSFQG